MGQRPIPPETKSPQPFQIEGFRPQYPKSSDIMGNWLPREDSNLGHDGYKLPEITFGLGLYLCHSVRFRQQVHSL